ncbi:MAG: TOBE domain protein [Bacteroidetes bacterium ADurb.Bin217]|nr:MAG: TOBE domain protein [Bacteroidetes bacterium ADurb.Bin217]
MNTLSAVITNIHRSGAIVLVDTLVESTPMSALLIVTDDYPVWLQPQLHITLICKETEVILAKHLKGFISIRNKLSCTVRNIIKSEILCTVYLQSGSIELSSIISKRALHTLDLDVGDHVDAYIQMNEISIMP